MVRFIKRYLFIVLCLIPTLCFAVGQDANTKALLHFDGADTSTTFTDEVGVHTWTAYNQAQLDTADKHFGTASALFDGTDDAIYSADHADWDLAADNTGSFTFDCWMKCNQVSHGHSLFAQRYDANTQSYFVAVDSGVGFNYWQAVVRIGGNYACNMYEEVTPYNCDDGWYHVALIKKAEDWGMYVDGDQIDYYDNSGSVTGTIAGEMSIGLMKPVTANDMDGWIDEWRWQDSNYFAVTPQADSSGTLTVPTEEYSEAVEGGVNSQVITIFTKFNKLPGQYSGYERIVSKHNYIHKDVKL